MTRQRNVYSLEFPGFSLLFRFVFLINLSAYRVPRNCGFDYLYVGSLV